MFPVASIEKQVKYIIIITLYYFLCMLSILLDFQSKFYTDVKFDFP